jgi:hypothetical protein
VSNRSKEVAQIIDYFSKLRENYTTQLLMTLSRQLMLTKRSSSRLFLIIYSQYLFIHSFIHLFLFLFYFIFFHSFTRAKSSFAKSLGFAEAKLGCVATQTAFQLHDAVQDSPSFYIHQNGVRRIPGRIDDSPCSAEA